MSVKLYKFRPFEMMKENYDENFIPGCRSGKNTFFTLSFDSF